MKNDFQEEGIAKMGFSNRKINAIVQDIQFLLMRSLFTMFFNRTERMNA